MAYQLSDLVTAVRKRAKDLSFDADLITDWLQATNNEVVERMRWPFMEVVDTDTLSADSTQYDLSDDLEQIVNISLIDPNNNTVMLRYVPYPEFYERHENPQLASEATPYEYTVFENAICWAAPLDRTYQLSVRYLKAPTTLLSDTDVPDVPEKYKEVMHRGALYRLEEYRGNFDIAALHERKVEELTEDMAVRTKLRVLTEAPKARFGRR